MFNVVLVAPPINTPFLYHWFPLPALLVSTTDAAPSHTTTGPTDDAVGVEGVGFTVTATGLISKHPDPAVPFI